ncbi:MAG: hypothetical protein PVI13_09475 [Desulfobacterales bacterium]
MKVFVTLCLFAGLTVFPVQADIIYFKDGMKTICQEKAWEEDGEIKCEYAGWVISYQKNDILRIVKTVRTKKKTPAEKKAPAKNSTPKKSSDQQHTAAQAEKNRSSAKPTAKRSVSEKLNTPSTQPSGPVFYDPRRPYKYWADQNSKHKSYREAIQALAKKYNRTSEWVQAHMGETNDLSQIHRNLAKPQSMVTEPKVMPEANQKPEVAFYNPRRPYPYWTGTTSKYKSFKEAIQALAKEYDRPPEWIKLNMGVTNDLNEIHKNLKQHKAASPAG